MIGIVHELDLSDHERRRAVVSGWILKDDDDAHSYALPSGSIVPAGGYLDVDTLSFGLGNPADAARLYESDGTTLVDEIYWNAASASNANSWTRCESSTGAWDVLDEPATPGAANNCPSPNGTDIVQGASASPSRTKSKFAEPAAR